MKQGPLIFTSKGAIVTRIIRKYLHFHRKIHKKWFADSQIVVEVFFKQYWSVFQPYMIFILLAKSRSIDSLILILASLYGAIVTESIIKCIYSDWKLNKESNGGVYIIFIDYFGRNKRIFFVPCHPFMFPFLSMTIPIYSVLQSETEYKKGKRLCWNIQCSGLLKVSSVKLIYIKR